MAVPVSADRGLQSLRTREPSNYDEPLESRTRGRGRWEGWSGRRWGAGFRDKGEESEAVNAAGQSSWGKGVGEFGGFRWDGTTSSGTSTGAIGESGEGGRGGALGDSGAGQVLGGHGADESHSR